MLFALAFLPMFGIGGLTGLPLGLARDRHPPARHLLRHRPLPLRRRAGDALRAVRRHLLLVPEGHRPQDERAARASPLLGIAHLHERHLPADVHPGIGGCPRRLYDGGAQYAHAKPVLHGTCSSRPRRSCCWLPRSRSSSTSSGASGRASASSESLGRHHAGVGRRDVASAGPRQLRAPPEVFRGPLRARATGSEDFAGLEGNRDIHMKSLHHKASTPGLAVEA